MYKRIYVSPSDQTGNLYAVGNTNEAVQCRKIAVALTSALKRCGFEAMTNIVGSMEARVAESNRWGADLHIPVHTNAFNTKVKGTRLMAYDTAGAGYKVCQAIMETLAPITPGGSDSITARPGLYEVRCAAAPTAYIEVAFHDNEVEAQWIINHTNQIAEAICKGVCKYYGVPYVEPVADMESNVIYRVQVGAFSKRTGAETLQKELAAAGFKGIIVKGEK